MTEQQTHVVQPTVRETVIRSRSAAVFFGALTLPRFAKHSTVIESL